MLELADRHVRGACAEMRMGSSPITCTKKEVVFIQLLFSHFTISPISSAKSTACIGVTVHPFTSSICTTIPSI